MVHIDTMPPAFLIYVPQIIRQSPNYKTSKDKLLTSDKMWWLSSNLRPYLVIRPERLWTATRNSAKTSMCCPGLEPRASWSVTFPTDVPSYAEWNPPTLRWLVRSYIQNHTTKQQRLYSRNIGKIQCCVNFSWFWAHIYERRISEVTSNRTPLTLSFSAPPPNPPAHFIVNEVLTGSWIHSSECDVHGTYFPLVKNKVLRKEYKAAP